MSKSIEALNRIETIMPFNRENKPNYYRQFIQSETPFYEDFDLVKKDLEILEIIKKWSFIQENYKDGYGKFTQFLCNIHTIGMEEDLKKVKEWLKNEN